MSELEHAFSDAAGLRRLSYVHEAEFSPSRFTDLRNCHSWRAFGDLVFLIGVYDLVI